MSEPPADTTATDAPTHEQLVNMFVTEANQALAAVTEAVRLHSVHPVTWHELAARLQYLGRGLEVLGRDQADALAAYAEANPDVTVPPDGPAVYGISPKRHAETWERARESVDMGVPDDYAAELVLTTAYAHPQLAQYGRALDDVVGVPGAMAVVQYVEHEGPDAVVRVLLGGMDPDEHREQVMAWLAEHGITPGEPRYYPPVMDTFLMFDEGPGDARIYDRFGRVVSDDANAAARLP